MAYELQNSLNKSVDDSFAGDGPFFINETFSWHQEPSTVDLLLQLYFPIIIGVSGILGNAVVCFIFIYKRHVFKSITNRLILNQSVIDFGSSVIFLLQRFAPRPGPSASPVWVNLVCRVWGSEFFLWALNNASTGNLVLISLERYFAICHPVKHRNTFSKKRILFACFVVYLLGFLLMVYAPFFSNRDYNCYIVFDNHLAQMIFGMLHFTVTYLLPLSIMVFCYSNILNLLQQRRKTRDHVKLSGDPFKQAKKNVTITLFAVSLAFVVCWTPASITFLLYNAGYPYDITSDMHAAFLTLVVCNMAVNPVVYAFTYKKFRRQIRGIFTCSTGIQEGTEQTPKTHRLSSKLWRNSW